MVIPLEMNVVSCRVSLFVPQLIETESQVGIILQVSTTQQNGVALSFPKFTCWIWSLVFATFFFMRRIFLSFV